MAYALKPVWTKVKEMSERTCDYCGKSFSTLSRLRLHQSECMDEPELPENTRVKALGEVGSGPQFQSALDQRRNRLHQHNVDTLEEAVQDLRETIRSFGPERLVRELWYHELIRSGSFGVLNEDTGIAPKMAEYLYGIATTISPSAEPPSAGFYDVIDALSLVYDHFRVQQFEILADADTVPEKRRATTRELLLERELTTGRFGHALQRREFTQHVYSHIDDELADLLGFSASAAVTVGDEISQLPGLKLGEGKLLPIVRRVIDVGDGPFQIEFEDIENNLSQGWPMILLNVAEYDKHRFNPLNSDLEAGEFPEYEEPFGMLHEAGPDSSFTPQEIASALNENISSVESIIEELSIALGSHESNLSDQSGSTTKFDYPFDHNPIHKYPIVKMPNGQYHLGPQNSLWYSLSTRFRYDILGTEYHGVGTEKIGVGVETWVANCLQKLSDDDVTIVSSVEYDYENGESDIALLYEDTLVVIECKTRGLRLESRLGPFGSFETIADDVREIVEEPYREQAMKLINGIKENEVSELDTDQGTIEVNSSDFSEYIPVVIVAEPLDFVGTILYADIIEFEDERPYFGDIYGWQTVCQHLSGSQELLSYLRQRIAVGVTGRAFSIDEIDYLGAYLDHCLDYPEIPSDAIVDIHHVGSHLEKIHESQSDLDVSVQM